MIAQPDWSILYRGPLSSCNYTCSYCPFAKTKNSRAELVEDARQLTRFVDWVGGRAESIGVLFTPWGEALIRPHYQRALVRLSKMSHVRRAVVQTNLSGSLDWLSDGDLSSLALWVTFHPDLCSLEDFMEAIQTLDELGVRHSVGVVGMRSHFPLIQSLRDQLAPTTYLWVNAYKSEGPYYSETEVELLSRIDPLFKTNNVRHPSAGRSCRTGSQVFSVDGTGDIRRCHFVQGVKGNIYSEGFEAKLRDEPCPNATCGCHIGYIHMPHLDLYNTFGDGLLERIPNKTIWNKDIRSSD